MDNRPHKKLLAWQKAMQLVMSVYRITSEFPKSELYLLTSQIRRSVISVPSNIAEGLTRVSAKDRSRFLAYAISSLSELDTQMDISAGLGYLSDDAYAEMQSKIVAVHRLLAGLIRKIRSASENSGSPFTVHCSPGE